MVANAGLLVGLLLLLPGGIATVRPDYIAWVLVRLDAISSRSAPTLDAARWYVAHVRSSGIAFLLLGTLVTLFALFR